MARVLMVQAELQAAKRETAEGKQAFTTGDQTIANVINGVTNGKIGGSVSADLLSVYETIKPIIKECQKFFDECDELMLRANKEYDTTTEDAAAALNANRF